MNAVSRKTTSTVFGQPRAIRSGEGSRKRQTTSTRTAPSSRQGSKPTSAGQTSKSTTSLTTNRPTKAGKKQLSDTLRAKEDEYRYSLVQYIISQLVPLLLPSSYSRSYTYRVDGWGKGHPNPESFLHITYYFHWKTQQQCTVKVLVIAPS